MNFPKISIITPSFNQGNYIEATILSILNQNYPNLEYIVIDGGSTDHSVDIIRRYENQLAYWVSEPDDGQTHALNKGFHKATGDILCWLCADDLYEPWTLTEVADFFQTHPKAQFVYGNALWIDPEDNFIRYQKEVAFNRFILLYGHNFIPQPSTFWRNDLHRKIGELDPSFDIMMDADLWLRFADFAQLYQHPRIWSRIRMHTEQKTQRLRGRGRLEAQMLRQRYFGKHSEQMFIPKKVVAKSTQLAWKLSAGCYW
jgi:glycosyltransferase involved in cell wall biosynthesis